MRTLIPLSTLGAALLLDASALAVNIDWVTVGDPGNACDPQSEGCFGSVASAYNIGAYEVTNVQYTEFLNAKAAADPLELYHTSMGASFGGITRTGASGTYSYSAIAGRENMPVNFVSFFDALRFANWLNNGGAAGDTETGAYTLLGGTPTPINGFGVTRNPGATIFLPSEDEWYKAAYYDALSTSYFDYPAGSDLATTCAAPTAAANSANCNAPGVNSTDPDVDDLTSVGSFTGSASPYGTFDQGGNVWEWNEAIVTFLFFPPIFRGVRGGTFIFSEGFLAAASRASDLPTAANNVVGFRVANLPEPGTGLLVIAGLLGLAGWRRWRA